MVPFHFMVLGLVCAEHNHVTPQPPSYKPPIPNITGEEFLNRFQRNASLDAASWCSQKLEQSGSLCKRDPW